MSIGTYPVRDGGDNYAYSMDFSAVDVFASSAVTSATATCTAASDGTPAALTVGAAAVASNVVTFRVSGGAEGVVYTVTVAATNGTDTVTRSAEVPTDAL